MCVPSLVIGELMYANEKARIAERKQKSKKKFERAE